MTRKEKEQLDTLLQKTAGSPQKCDIVEYTNILLLSLGLPVLSYWEERTLTEDNFSIHEAFDMVRKYARINRFIKLDTHSRHTIVRCFNLHDALELFRLYKRICRHMTSHPDERYYIMFSGDMYGGKIWLEILNKFLKLKLERFPSWPYRAVYDENHYVNKQLFFLTSDLSVEELKRKFKWKFHDSFVYDHATHQMKVTHEQ